MNLTVPAAQRAHLEHMVATVFLVIYVRAVHIHLVRAILHAIPVRPVRIQLQALLHALPAHPVMYPMRDKPGAYRLILMRMA